MPTAEQVTHGIVSENAARRLYILGTNMSAQRVSLKVGAWLMSRRLLSRT